MKKWIMSSCMGAVLALSMGAVAMAQNGEAYGAECNPETEELGVPNGFCVNCVNSGTDFAECICKNAGVVFPGERFLGFANLGECVAAIAATQ